MVTTTACCSGHQNSVAFIKTAEIPSLKVKDYLDSYKIIKDDNRFKIIFNTNSILKEKVKLANYIERYKEVSLIEIYKETSVEEQLFYKYLRKMGINVSIEQIITIGKKYYILCYAAKSEEEMKPLINLGLKLDTRNPTYNMYKGEVNKEKFLKLIRQQQNT